MFRTGTPNWSYFEILGPARRNKIQKRKAKNRIVTKVVEEKAPTSKPLFSLFENKKREKKTMMTRTRGGRLGKESGHRKEREGEPVSPPNDEQPGKWGRSVTRAVGREEGISLTMDTGTRRDRGLAARGSSAG